METLSIKSKQPFSLDSLQTALSRHWHVEESTDDTLVVHGTNARAYLHPIKEFGTDERFGLLVDYSDMELAKKIVEIIADNPAVTIDNDFGTILPGDQFVARCKSVEGWDWRRRP
jgi:hypothetical protein